MSDRVHNEFGSVKSLQGGAMHVRPHLAVGPVPEISDSVQAVAPTGLAQRIPDNNLPEDNKALLEVIGSVRQDEDVLVRNAEHRKAVDDIMARLFQARDKVVAHDQTVNSIKPIVEAIDRDLESLEEKFPGIQVIENSGLDKQKPHNAAERAATDDRSRVIAKIEAALKRVEKLRSEITVSDDSVFTHLLNMGSAVSGLNVARNRISETGSSLSSAVNTAENVMVNLRAIVLATHSKVSPEIVRLILP